MKLAPKSALRETDREGVSGCPISQGKAWEQSETLGFLTNVYNALGTGRDRGCGSASSVVFDLAGLHAESLRDARERPFMWSLNLSAFDSR